MDFEKTPLIDRTYFPGVLGTETIAFPEVGEKSDFQASSDIVRLSEGYVIPRGIAFEAGYFAGPDFSAIFSDQYILPYRPVWSDNSNNSNIIIGSMTAEPMSPRLSLWAGGRGQSSQYQFGPLSDNDALILNLMNYKGFNDWRVPTIQELSVLSKVGVDPEEIKTPPLYDGSYGRYYTDSSGQISRARTYNVFITQHIVRGTSVFTQPPATPAQVTITPTNGIGGKTICTPSGVVPYGTMVTCSGQPDEGFIVDWRDTFPVTLSAQYVSASCVPTRINQTPLLIGNDRPQFFAEDKTFNISAVRDCDIKYQAYTQVRSLVLTEVSPPAAGTLSCSETVSKNWVKLGDTGTCQIAANPGYKLRAISGCNGNAGQDGTFLTGTIAESCTVTAEFMKTQAIAFDPPVIPPFSEGQSVELSAIASSGRPVTYSAGPPTICSVTGSTLNMLAPGLCTLTITQEGNEEFESAPPLVYSISLSERPQIVAAGAVSVPTLGHWALMLMGFLAAALAGGRLRRAAI
ncbi:MAG: IPTL-CTERM sorting domain-containing protein [Comamonadaceae bacterium]|nr:IPTL-CTERM sorting domain-containing protein [Comamonadaceae bacterium]